MQPQTKRFHGSWQKDKEMILVSLPVIGFAVLDEISHLRESKQWCREGEKMAEVSSERAGVV